MVIIELCKLFMCKWQILIEERKKAVFGRIEVTL